MNKELNQKLLEVSAALMDLCTTITTLQKGLVTLFASLPDYFEPEPDEPETQIEEIERTIELDPQPYLMPLVHESSTPNTVGIKTLNGIDGVAIRTVTPKSIAEAIAAATNLELFDGDVKDYLQIGYRTPIGTFMRVTDFRHDDIAIKIATKSVGDWMKITVTNIMEKTQGLKAVDEYRKRKATR